MTERWNLAAWVVALALVVGLPLARGRVVFPHDNALEVGVWPDEESPWVSNRKFDDQNRVYLPALHHQLTSDSASWIPTWDRATQMGRSAVHTTGLSKAYFVTCLLSFLSRDPLVVYTWLTALAALAAAVFAQLLLRELGLHPTARLVGSLGLSIGVFSSYWTTFALFQWTIAWTLGILWLIAASTRRFDAPRALGLALAVHALLVSGYPQQTVWHLWLVLGFAAHRLLTRVPGWGARLRLAGALAAAGAVGGLASLPAWLDLARDAGLSARVDVDVEFFLGVLPKLDGWRALAGYLGTLFDPFWAGNPIRPDYPQPFNGVAFGPAFACLLAASALGARRWWPAHAFAALALVMTVWPAAYALGVEHAFLDVSRFVPLAGAVVPLHVLAALAVDRVLRGEAGSRAVRAGLGLATLAGGLGALLAGGAPPAPSAWLGALAAAGTLAFLWTARWPWIAAAAGLSCVAAGSMLRLQRPPDTVRWTSPAVESIRRALLPGTRYAIVDPRPDAIGPGSPVGTFLASNEENLLGLRSLHAYNSISPMRYQRFVSRLSSARPWQYGRHFDFLCADQGIDWDELERAGVGVLICMADWRPDPARFLPVPGTPLFRSVRPPFVEGRTRAFEPGDGEARTLPDGAGRGLSREGLRRVVDQDDRLVFELDEASEPALVVVGEAFHPGWSARVDGAPAAAVCVDDFFLGVEAPAGAGRVELRFGGAVRWAWIPQAGFPAAGLLLLARGALRRRRGPREAAAA